jgi:hypothetical protein
MGCFLLFVNNDVLFCYDYWLISTYPNSCPKAHFANVRILTFPPKLNQLTE